MFPEVGRRVKRGPVLERLMSLQYRGTESEVNSAVTILIVKQ